MKMLLKYILTVCLMLAGSKAFAKMEEVEGEPELPGYLTTLLEKADSLRFNYAFTEAIGLLDSVIKSLKEIGRAHV